MNSSKLVNVGTIQSTCDKDVEANRQKFVRELELLAVQGAQIICSQELVETLYFCDEEIEENFDLAKEIDELVSFYSPIALKNQVVLIVSIFEKRAAGIYHNTVLCFDADGSYLGKYRKQHIPDDPGFYEKYYFTPGDEGYKVFDTKYGKVGTLICWDQWFPEAARLVALQGADVIFYPTAIGWELDSPEALKKKEYNAWKVMHQSHAVANGVHIVAVNRVGTEAGTEFWGGSVVIDPFGETLYQAGLEAESTITTIDLNETERTRRRWPYLRDRRVDTYSDLTKKWLADD